jgi:parvulin-like peptidyl-prolyl isomerase
MKALTLCFVLSAIVYGQANGPVTVTPGAPVVQSPQATTPPAAPAHLPPDTVVAEVNGKKYTAAEMDQLIAMLPPQYQQLAKGQPQMLGQLFLMRRLAEDAEKAGLDKKAPYKDQLAMQRIQLLSTAELTDVGNNIAITQEDQAKYYKDNAEKFKQVKVRAIYIAFNSKGPAPGGSPENAKKPRTEAEAQAKIDDLAKQVKAGADFGKLARENSDDQESAAKDGDYGMIKPESAFPPAIKTAVFALKQGEVSAPIKQPNGFYLIRAEEVSTRSFTDSIADVIQGTKQAKLQEWLKGIQDQYNIKVENPAYFAPRVSQPLPPVH